MGNQTINQRFENVKLLFLKEFRDRKQITVDEWKEFVCIAANVADFRAIANWTMKFKVEKIIEQIGTTDIFEIDWDAYDGKKVKKK